MSQAAVSADEARHRLYQIMKGDDSFEEKAREALELGRSYLAVESGFLTRIQPEADHWETLISTDGDDGIAPEGMTADFSGTYCRHTLERDSPLALHNVSEQETAVEPDGYDCYHGTTLTVSGEPYGTVCFVARDARTEPFSEAETMFAELVSRLLEHELEHERQREQLGRQTSLVNVLDRVLRHNIRNELTVIRANARLHSEKHEECTECEKIVAAADELISMSETARQLGKSINAEFERRPTDLVGLIEETVEQANTRYPELSLTAETPETLVASVYPSLGTALWELVENAAEHAGDSPSVSIRLRETGDCIELSVVDDGPGLPQAERDVLQTGTESQLVHGSGLGLWSVYWVATGHNGDIDIETERGTRVALSLPKRVADGSDTSPQVPRAADRYEAAFGAVPVGLALLDDDGTILDTNERAATILDESVRTLVGRPVADRIDSVTGPLDGESGMAGSGTVERSGSVITYSLVADILPGQHLLALGEP